MTIYSIHTYTIFIILNVHCIVVSHLSQLQHLVPAQSFRGLSKHSPGFMLLYVKKICGDAEDS